MLHDRHFAEHFAHQHFDQPPVHLFPATLFNTGNVIQHGTVLVERASLHFAHKLDALQVHVLWRIRVDNVHVHDTRWLDVTVVNQLRTAQNVCHMLVVIQPPHAMTASRFQLVCALQVTDQVQVLVEHSQHQQRIVSLVNQT